jgi:cell wall-associated NlpC family hydrolase
MSTRRLFLLPTLALAATVVASAAAMSDIGFTTGSGQTAAAGVLEHPKPFHRPVRPAGMAPVEKAPSLGERAARIALREVGVPYRWGGESPSGFDCSGLVRWTYLRVGVNLPHNSYALFGRGRSVSRPHMEPGDVLFFDGLGHVGLYVGHGRMVHAPFTGANVEVVRLADWYGSRLVGARRVVSA